MCCQSRLPGVTCHSPDVIYSFGWSLKIEVRIVGIFIGICGGNRGLLNNRLFFVRGMWVKRGGDNTKNLIETTHSRQCTFRAMTKHGWVRKPGFHKEVCCLIISCRESAERFNKWRVRFIWAHVSRKNFFSRPAIDFTDVAFSICRPEDCHESLKQQCNKIDTFSI